MSNRFKIPVSKRRSGAAARAFSLMEVMLALFIFSVMAVLVAVALPAATRSTRYSADYTHAASLAMHKVNQIQEAGYASMNGPALGQSGLDIVDGTPTTPTAVANDDGSETASFEFTTTDNLWQVFSAGRSTANYNMASTASNRPRGYIDIAPYTPSARLAGTVTVYDFIQVTIRVTWENSRGRTQSFSTRTLVSRTPIN